MQSLVNNPIPPPTPSDAYRKWRKDIDNMPRDGRQFLVRQQGTYKTVEIEIWWNPTRERWQTTINESTPKSWSDGFCYNPDEITHWRHLHE